MGLRSAPVLPCEKEFTRTVAPQTGCETPDTNESVRLLRKPLTYKANRAFAMWYVEPVEPTWMVEKWRGLEYLGDRLSYEQQSYPIPYEH